MKRTLTTAAIVTLATFGVGGMAHADISQPADPIPQQQLPDDCLGTTTRWTLQPCGPAAPAPVVTTAPPPVRSTTCVKTYGEFQRLPNIEAPCRLDIAMYPGRLHHRTAAQRCADEMSGVLVQVRFKIGRVLKTLKVCKNVDY